MEIEQLELDLWHSLEIALKFPQTANFQQLCHALESEIAEQSMAEQLQVAAEVLNQLSQVYAARVELLLSDWERRYNPSEPVVDLDECVGLFVQSLHLDVADLFEPSEPVQYPANRQSRTVAALDSSVVGLVDKAVLMAVAEQSSAQRAAEAQPLTEAELAQQVQQLAHSENIDAWASAISQWLEEQHEREVISLVQLQQSLGMPMIELWLGLLLSGENQYEWEQRGNFYDPESIWLKPM